jgi:hypothetical protein
MGVEQHRKVDVATEQLESAIRLFFYGNDYYSALTLAGAAEEIFGQMLLALGKEPRLHSFARSYTYLMNVLNDQQLDELQVRREANAARNAVKHFNSFSELTVVFDAREEAVDMISRAADNRKALFLEPTEEIQRFEKFYEENW